MTTGLCRAFVRRGIAVAPFKAQNMSNNSMVTADGAEIGRAQWVQARAACAEPEAAMNPVLLKPGDDKRSHVVVMGQPAGTLDAANFIDGRERLASAAFSAFDDVASRYDVVICEGAGSPAEINLRRHDFVNMGLARHADLQTIVVGDIDRGGVFAALFGTLALLEPADQELIAGFVMNKFRGDISLLEPGLQELERLTDRPTFGVLPWHPDLWLDSEDALDVHGRRNTDGSSTVRIAVVRLPRISNFTDVDVLGLEPGVDVRFVSDPRGLSDVDLVILPGTRATLADLQWLRERGLADAIVEYADRGGAVLGVCGGFQMLGRSISDPHGVEGEAGAKASGLGLLNVTTEFTPDKVVRLRRLDDADAYEIHHGRVTVADGVERYLHDGARQGRVMGTMWHGSLESDTVRAELLQEIGGTPSGVVFAEARERRLDLLGDMIEMHLDVDALVDLSQGVTA